MVIIVYLDRIQLILLVHSFDVLETILLFDSIFEIYVGFHPIFLFLVWFLI